MERLNVHSTGPYTVRAGWCGDTTLSNKRAAIRRARELARDGASPATVTDCHGNMVALFKIDDETGRVVRW